LILAAAAAFAQGSDYDHGVALFERGDVAAAVPYLARAAQQHPRNAQAWKALGVSYAAQKMYREAEGSLHRACRLDPKLEDACYFYARALYALDRFEESLAALGRADHESWKVQLGMAQALEALSRAAEAEKAFHRAVDLARGNDPRPGVGLGLFLIRQGRSAEAIPIFEEVVARFPNAADAHLNLGRALFEENRAADAVPHLERAVALDPSSAQAQLLLAKAYVRTGRAAEAQAHFAAAARLGAGR
jgi:tetratricopeptide (TPR) repeat protein